MGLQLAKSLEIDSLKVYIDSQIMVGQINGNYEVKEEWMVRYLEWVNKLKRKFE